MPKKWMEDDGEIAAFLDKALVGRLGTSFQGQPYITPLAFVFRDGKFYFHSGPKGRKMEYIKANPRVCFEVDELNTIHFGSSACSHSFRYSSVIALGTARLIDDADLKRRALNWLVIKYSGEEWISKLSETDLAGVEVVEVEVDELTGKRNVDH